MQVGPALFGSLHVSPSQETVEIRPDATRGRQLSDGICPSTNDDNGRIYFMTSHAPRSTQLIINGKSAGDPALWSAVKQVRKAGHSLVIRVTWEGGDAAR